MKRVWKILGIAALAAILGTAAVGVAVMAQDGGSDGPFDFAAKFKEALAGILGVSVEEYDAAVDKAQEQVVDEAVTEGWLTEDQAATMKERMAEAPDMGMPGMGRGFGGHGLGMDRGDADLLSIAAGKLGMELSDLRTELQNGKTIVDVAKEKSVDTQEIVDAYLAKVKENLDVAVADGKITQKQADSRLEQAQERVTDQLDNAWPDRGPGGMGPMGMGHEDADLLSIAADKLGMELSDLRTELQNGKTIADVAKEKSVDTQGIVAAYLAKVKENLDAAVADGKITQEQADSRLEQAQERVTDQLDNTWPDRGPGGFPGGGRPGGRGGFPGQGGE